MPKPSIFWPERRPGTRKSAPTPEQIAAKVVAKLKSPVGSRDKAVLPLTLVLPRVVIERLIARAQRAGSPSLAAWVEAVLEREGSR